MWLCARVARVQPFSLPSSSILIKPTCTRRLIHLESHFLNRLPKVHTHPYQRSLFIPPPPPTPRFTPIQGAIDPLTAALVLSISFGIAYITATYTDKSEATSDDNLSSDTDPLPTASEDLDEMAPNMPPGRPGNLTPEQTEKLKEMWLATLDVFGVAKDESQPQTAAAANGTSSSSTSTDEKKKRRTPLKMFGKKSKDGASGGSGNAESNNDKHGQTKEFEQALASQTPEELRAAFWSMAKHDNPDALLLRFLRARKWDIHGALIMLVSTMHWRSQEMHVDDQIMWQGEEHALKESKSSNSGAKKEGDDFLAQMRMGKSFLHGTDKDGRPCCYVRVKLHKQGEQSEKSLERFTVYTIETARMLLRPPIDTATIVFDMTDFSMANMDYTPVKFMIKCFEANYPESLGSVLVYKSPWVFQGIWKIIKGWLDPVVASKVHFASNADELSQFVPKKQIPVEMGGEEQWKYEYVEPVEGENKAMEQAGEREKVTAERKELVSSYESETLSWLHGEDGGEGRGRLAERLAANYWRLDPYVRAKSLYDRTGVIQEGGKLDFYPKKQTPGQAAGGGDDDLD